MDYSTYYQPQQPYVVFQQPPAAAPSSTQSSGISASEESFRNASPNNNYGTNYDAFAAFDREILAAQGSQVYGQNGSTEDVPGLNRSSSEEKELTPQQSKRKAQNRAAQRAFRERKERHVKELEEKLSTLEASSSNVLSENERLKREIQKITTENQILRATSAAQAAHQPPAPAAVDVGPMAYSPTDFYDVVLEPHKNKTPSHRISHHPETGESLLGAAAAWDLITNDPLYIDGQVDIQAVSEFLKPKAKCDGQGPVFPESEVRKAIQLSASLGKDELI
ncbi:hypothetical protein TWF569_009308 [Orbilia oligospora]|uniref:BZIP domain-containing protein n=1 Tax=Orbilia oligospora TaxID=2813651 RepID=A0A7C8PQF4_ORBOL|nr:hypothetical protein TWF102_003245 [Orbilia oligospora]KAF3078776.1 hypothetical protein TWF102_003245 [Orbilia oligospora]KAF3094589.1 hypothetical protein TWF706_008427 [Orbilia oligospora]KAF3096508.1 hypothetical protein TWF103_009842 [Orbilia oligospora]KAF3096509.1 hypothetical protein TWF103_009842 [Orbilia oligospora]